MFDLPQNAEILHESTGLTIHRNENNKFVVCTLYYFADPAKRREEWIRTAKAGMTPAKWNKEYEIDYLAQFGERAFPELVERRDEIIVTARDFDTGGTFWGGFDYGARNPTSFHVYTWVDGCFYAIWELYKPCKSIREFAAEIKACPYYHRLKYIAADPSFFDARSHNADGIPDSVANLFIKEGVTKFIKGSQDEQTWMAIIRKHWEPRDPTFKICENCRMMVKEFEECTFQDYSNERMRQESNFKEGIQDKNNHALDDNKYFFNSQPVIPHNRGTKPQRALIDKWYGWDGRSKRMTLPDVYDTNKRSSSTQNPRFKEFVQ